MTTLHFTQTALLPGKYLHHTISSCANYPLPILAPYTGADTLTAHHTVARDFLRARSLLQTPEAQRGVVTGAD